MHLLRCCQCVRQQQESRDADSRGCRPHTSPWDGVAEGEWQESGADVILSPPDYLLPLPSHLLQPTSKMSMEPMAVRDDRSWPFATNAPLRPWTFDQGQHLGHLAAGALPLPMYDAVMHPLQASTALTYTWRSPTQLTQLPVQPQQDVTRSHEARELLRTMLSPAAAATASRPSPRTVLAKSPSTSTTPRGSSAPPALRQLRLVSPLVVRTPVLAGATTVNSTVTTPPFAMLVERRRSSSQVPLGQTLKNQKLYEAQDVLKGMLSPKLDVSGVTNPITPRAGHRSHIASCNGLHAS